MNITIYFDFPTVLQVNVAFPSGFQSPKEGSRKAQASNTGRGQKAIEEQQDSRAVS